MVADIAKRAPGANLRVVRLVVAIGCVLGLTATTVGASAASVVIPPRPALKVSCYAKHGGVLRYVTSTSLCHAKTEGKINYVRDAPVYTCAAPNPVGVATTARRQDTRGLMRRVNSAKSCHGDYQLTLPASGPRSFCVDAPSRHLRNLAGGYPCHKSGEFKVILSGAKTTPGVSAPVSHDDTAATDEITPLAIAVLGNDSSSGTGLHVASVGVAATRGTVTISADGQSVVYDPNGQFRSLKAGETATDTFTYVAADSNGLSSAATVTVTITGVNQPPVAVADTAVTDKLSAATISVLANDGDPDSDALSVASVGTAGTVGSVAISPDRKSITYDPNGHFAGLAPTQSATDSFTYEANDGHVDSNTVTVTVTINGINSAPVLSGTEVGALAYGTGNPPVAITSGLAIADADGTTLVGATVSISSGFSLSHDTLGFAAQNGITGVYDNLTGALALSGAASLANYQAALRSITFSADDPTPTGTRTISFQVNDGGLNHNLSNVATRTITLTHVNHPPVAGDDTPASISEDGPAATIAVLANDSDPDGDTPLHVALVAGPTSGTVTANTSSFTFDPAGQFEALGAGVPSTVTFTYRAVDPTAAVSNIATVSVTVVGVDDPPVAVNDSATVTEDAAATAVAVLANDTDVDGGPKSIASVTQPANGTVVITGGGTGLTYKPNANFCNAPPGTTPDTFTYTLNGGSTATASMTVTCVDDPPVAVNDSVTVTEDAAATAVAVLANDTDVDGGPKSIASVTQPANGTVVITGGGTGLTYKPNANFCNAPPGTTPDTFTYTLNGGSTATVSMTVTCVDDAPVAVDDSATVAQDSGTSAVAVLANDTDVDGGPKSIASVTQPANGTVVITGGGAGLTYAPNAGYCNPPATPDTFTYTLTPGGSTATVSMTVTCADVPPVAVDDSATVTEDAAATAVAVLANDTDVDGGPKSIASVTQPANGTVVITGGGTGLTYKPNANFCDAPPGTTPDTFTYTLTPGGSTATVSMTVTCVDDPPVAVNDSVTVTEDAAATAVAVLANDTDVDGGPKSIASVTQPANGTVVITGGGTGLTYKPNANFCNAPPGTTPDTFTYTLTPGGSNATVSMTVTCVNDAPVAVDDSATAVGNTTLVVDAPGDGPPSVTGPKKSTTGDILGNDTDVDTAHANLTVTPGTFASNDGGTVVIESDGDYTFTPAAGTSCTDTSDFFDYTVNDNDPTTPLTDTGRVNVTITGCVWYVNNNAVGNAGTSTAPFDTLAQAQTASAAGQTIFVADGDGTSTGYSAGLALKDNQRLIGEAADLVIGADTLSTAVPANRPTITDSNSDVITLAKSNTVRGVDINPSGTGGGIFGGLAASTGGTIDNVKILDTGTAGTQPGLELNASAGTFAVSDLTVDNTGGSAASTGILLANAGTVTFAPASTISVTGPGKALDATGTALGTSTFDSLTSTGSATGGVSLVTTTGTITFADLSLTTSSGAAAGFLLNNAGSVSVPPGGTDNVSATGGPAIDVSASTNPSLAFDTVSSASSAGKAINLSGLGSGTFSAGGGTLAGFAGTAFDVNGASSGTISYAGAINNGTGKTANISGRTAGTVTVSGNIADAAGAGGGITLSSDTGGSTTFSGASKVLNTGVGDGVAMTSSDGHTLTFSGGGLGITTTSGKGFDATSSGTLAVTGTGNTISSGTGRALGIVNTDIGASDVTFQSIASAGAPDGIVLDTTDVAPGSGSLVVTGNGGTCTAADQSGCSGGQISGSTGADDSSTAPVGTGVVLKDTADPSLTRMWIHGASNYAIRGHNVANLTFANGVVNGTNGDNATTPFNDSSVAIDNLTGSATVSNSAISGGFQDNFRVLNTAGSLDRVTFSGDTFGDNSAAGGNDSLNLQSLAPATALKATIQNTAFTGAAGDLVQYAHNGTGLGDLVMSADTLSNNHPGIATGGGGVSLYNNGASGNTTMDIQNNTFRDAVGQGVLVVKDNGGTATQTGTFSNNTIGVSGSPNTGSAEGTALELQTLGQGSDTWTVANNNIFGYNNFGIEVLAGGSATLQSGAVNATITGNTISQPGTAAGTLGFPKNAIHFNIGTVPGDTYNACAAISGNDIASGGAPTVPGGAGGEDIRMRQRQSTTIRLPGYSTLSGANTDTTGVQNFLIANNPAGGPSAIASVNSPGGGFTGGAPATCP